MSARVVNPFSLFEMRRLREAVAARPASFRPDPEARARVSRNLYGRASADDSRSFAAKELADQRERAAERWGFDFLRDVPRTHGPGVDRYKWSRVKIGTVPAAYRMPRMAPLPAATATPLILETARTTVPSIPEASSTAAVAEAISSPTPTTTTTVAAGLVSPDLASPPPCSSSSAAAAPCPAPSPSVRQTTINEFMVCRKRSPSKKTAEGINPAKRARMEPGSTEAS